MISLQIMLLSLNRDNKSIFKHLPDKSIFFYIILLKIFLLGNFQATEIPLQTPGKKLMAHLSRREAAITLLIASQFVARMAIRVKNWCEPIVI